MCKLFVFIFILATLCTIDAARILGVFPTPSVSHQVVFKVLMKELASRGHEVVMITTDPAFPKGQAPANLTEIDLHDISYDYLLNLFSQAAKDEFEYGKKISWILQEKQLRVFFEILEIQVKSEPMQKFIQERRQFDILLIEAYMRPAIAYSYIFKAPVILVSSLGATLENLIVFGAPTHPILYPTIHHQRLLNLSLWEKLQEYYNHAQFMYLQKSFARSDTELAQRMFGPNVPPIFELEKNIDMLFLNVHPIWMNNQPVPPNVVFMGGLHQHPIKELPEDLKLYLDSSTNGVIYVSFGTNVHPEMFSTERLDVITEALSELPYDILFRWSGDIKRKFKNIKFSKWLPQSDLLRHPKIKAFVMQGGLQSTDEAITAGVPLVCIPTLGDQWYNAEKYVQLDIGLQLDLLKVTKAELKSAIERVSSNSSYRENIVRLRARMSDQPQSPLERAVWWVEYVLRHGGARHLRAPAAHMAWADYYELELLLIVLTCLVISISIVSFIIVWLWRYVKQRTDNNVKVKIS